MNPVRSFIKRFIKQKTEPIGGFAFCLKPTIVFGRTSNGVNQKGFSLPELIIVIGIIIFLSAIILPNYRTASSNFILERSAYKLGQDIRRAAEMAMSANELPGIGVPGGGYGIYFNINSDTGDNTKYKIYADTDPNFDEYFTSSDTTVEEITLEKGAVIQNIDTSSKAISINFKPPAPTVKITDKVGNEQDTATITLALENNPAKTKTLTVNKAGLVDVQ